MVKFSLLQKNSPANPSGDDVKEVLDGNICRCTGYRPIFDAFLSFTEGPLPEIEELVTKENRLRCPRTNKACSGSCSPKVFFSPFL